MTDIAKFSKMGVTKIRDVSILDVEEFSTINNLSKELQRTFEVKQVFRTETEMKYSVLNDMKFPTIPSKYWQSIREQSVFFSQLVYLACDYEEKQGELELLEIDLEEIDVKTKRGNAQEKIKKAQIKRAEFVLQEMKVTAKDRVREISIWEDIKVELSKLEKFDINDVNAHQIESYKLRWANEAELGQKTGDISLMRNSLSQLNTIMKEKPQISDSTT